MNSSRTLVFNKPYGVLSCFTDPKGRPTLAGFIPIPDVYAAGRLDFDSEGLLLLTSDGKLAQRIMDPKQKVPKVYWVQVERIPEADSLHRLQEGVLLSGQRTRPRESRSFGRTSASASAPGPNSLPENRPHRLDKHDHQ